MAGFVEGQGQGALQFGAQGFDLRCQPGLGQAFGPQQLVGKGRELGRLATFPDDQRLANRLLPFLEQPPHVAVGQVQLARGRRDGAFAAHRLQEVHELVADQGVAFALGAELVAEGDLSHGASVPQSHV